MNKFLYIITILTSLTLGGCSTTTVHRIAYDQPSPRIALDKKAGPAGYVRPKDDTRYNGFAILDRAAGQKGEVSIKILFDFEPKTRNRRASVRNCVLYVKPSDSSQYDRYDCTARFTGSGFMIDYVDNGKDESHDLDTLPGVYKGNHRPSVRGGRFFDYYFRGVGFRTYSFEYHGPDPLK